MIPQKLKPGDEIRVIAPSRSLSIMNDESKEIAIKTLEGMGFKVSFSENCEEIDEFEVEPSKQWSDEPWFLDQENRTFFENKGCKVINEGSAKGKIMGGNLCTLNLLQGTKYMPNLEDTILFIEDDSLSSPETFDRDLQSLIHQPNFHKVKGIVLGKFQIDMNITEEKLYKIIKTKEALNNIPVIAEVNFGHTNPAITFPIGGETEIDAHKDRVSIKIIKH